MRIILLGPPGSGKGTQGKLIEKKYKVPHISTGDLLRKEVEEGTPLGKEAEAIMRRGELVSDDVMIKMIWERVIQPEYQKGYVLDGFPRTIAQAQKLEEVDQKHDEVAIEIHLSDQALLERLASRRVCPHCERIYNLLLQPPIKSGHCDKCAAKLIQREDDRPEVIKDRLKVYHQQTKPLIDHYSQRKVFFRINGQASIEDIFMKICLILDKKFANSTEVAVTE